MAMSDYSLSDIAAVTEGGGSGGGRSGWGDGGWWILLLFILLGGWNGSRGFGGGQQGGGYQMPYGGAGAVGGNELYPWMELQGNINSGFSSLSNQLCGCCSDMQQTVSNGFAGVEASANARQIANMQQGFANQAAMMQGFSGVQAQTAQLASDIQLGNAQQTATILAENCADRAALSDGVRDIIASNAANTQSIIDKLCQLELDGYKRENSQLQAQLNAANLAASQAAQNTLIQQGFANEVDALYNRLSNCPVPSMPVYGRTPIFTCQPQNQGCGCGCGN